MKGLIIHQHGLEIGTRKIKYMNFKYSNYNFNDTINLEENLIYNFYCSKCGRYSLNYYDHDNYNYCYMLNPSNSNIIKFQDNFKIGYILLGNEIERENYIYNYFNGKIEKLKNDNISLLNEKKNLIEKNEQIIKTQNLLEKDNSKLSEEIKTLNNNNDNNEKKFQVQINKLNNKIEKKK